MRKIGVIGVSVSKFIFRLFLFSLVLKWSSYFRYLQHLWLNISVYHVFLLVSDPHVEDRMMREVLHRELVSNLPYHGKVVLAFFILVKWWKSYGYSENSSCSACVVCLWDVTVFIDGSSA